MLENNIPVICFHRISDEFSPAYPPIPVMVFDKICKYLSTNYNIIHPYAIFEPNYSKKQSLLVTFDDAYLDFYENALPILKKYQIPAVQHVVTMCADSGKPFWTQRLNKIIEAYYKSQQHLVFAPLNLDKKLKNKSETEQVSLQIYKYLLGDLCRNKLLVNLEGKLKSKVEHTEMMTWEHIKEVTNENIVIGSHTHSHENLSKLSEEKITEELLKSKELIKSNIPHQEMMFLAYPNGQFNDKVVGLAKKCGYHFAFTVEDKSYSSKTNKLQIPRYQVYHSKWWKNYLRLKFQVK